MSDYILELNANEEENIKLTDNDGNKVLWDERGLQFFNANFPAAPIWYNKRVAFGTAEHGEYVELSGWERTPSIHLAISNFPVFLRAYAGSGQVINVGYKNESKDGFEVIAKLEALGYEDYVSNYNINISAENETRDVWLTTTEDNCNRIVFDANLRVYEDFQSEGAAQFKVSLYKVAEDGTFEFHSDLIDGPIYGDGETNRVLDSGIISPDKYRVRVYINHVTHSGNSWARIIFNTKRVFYTSNSEIATGEVNWIAVENAE